MISAQPREDTTAAFEEVAAAQDRLDRVGVFIPVFGHHYGKGHVPVNPTVAEDLGMLVLISHKVLQFIERHLNLAALV